MAKSRRIDTSGNGNLDNNPFASLGGDLPEKKAPESRRVKEQKTPEQETARAGTVKVRREKSGRGGKIVTVIHDFEHAPNADALQSLLKAAQKQLGCGGTTKEGTLELQGNQTDKACQWLKGLGYRAVRSGG